MCVKNLWGISLFLFSLNLFAEGFVGLASNLPNTVISTNKLFYCIEEAASSIGRTKTDFKTLERQKINRSQISREIDLMIEDISTVLPSLYFQTNDSSRNRWSSSLSREQLRGRGVSTFVLCIQRLGRELSVSSRGVKSDFLYEFFEWSDSETDYSLDDSEKLDVMNVFIQFMKNVVFEDYGMTICEYHRNRIFPGDYDPELMEDRAVYDELYGDNCRRGYALDLDHFDRYFTEIGFYGGRSNIEKFFQNGFDYDLEKSGFYGNINAGISVYPGSRHLIQKGHDIYNALYEQMIMYVEEQDLKERLDSLGRNPISPWGLVDLRNVNVSELKEKFKRQFFMFEDLMAIIPEPTEEERYAYVESCNPSVTIGGFATCFIPDESLVPRGVACDSSQTLGGFPICE